MARRDPDGISFCHQRAPLRHAQQKAARRPRISDSLSRIGVAPRRAARRGSLAASSVFKKGHAATGEVCKNSAVLESKRHAIEFRHKSWFDDEIAECLERHAVAVCMSGAADWPMGDRVTKD